MATDVVTIWNRALSAAGGRGLVSTISEPGREADLCRLWYPQVRDSVLKAASWPCASEYARLAVLAERTNGSEWDVSQPPPTWRFAYATPSNMLAPRHLMSYGRFIQSTFQNKNVIATNDEEAILHYTKLQDDTSKWDAGVEHAVIASLAAQLALPLSGKVTRARELADRATEVVLLARTDFANESDDNYEALPSWIGARGYEMAPVATRYFWPYGNLLGVAA